MNRACLLLDGSYACVCRNASGFTPTFAIAIQPLLAAFGSAWFEVNPLGQLTVVCMRDGLAECLCPLTSSASQVASAIVLKYGAVAANALGTLQQSSRPGSGLTLASMATNAMDVHEYENGGGDMSLQNGLLLAASSLHQGVRGATELGAAFHDENLGRATAPLASAEGTKRGTASAMATNIFCICASVTSLDPGDVMSTLRSLRGLGTKVHVASLAGAPFLLDQAAQVTGGTFAAPNSLASVASWLMLLLQEGAAGPQVSTFRTMHADNSPRRRAGATTARRPHHDGAEGDSVMAVLPVGVKPLGCLDRPRGSDMDVGTDGGRQGQERADVGATSETTATARECPWCRDDLLPFESPTACRTCGLVTLNAVDVVASAAAEAASGLPCRGYPIRNGPVPTGDGTNDGGGRRRASSPRALPPQEVGGNVKPEIGFLEPKHSDGDRCTGQEETRFVAASGPPLVAAAVGVGGRSIPHMIGPFPRFAMDRWERVLPSSSAAASVGVARSAMSAPAPTLLVVDQVLRCAACDGVLAASGPSRSPPVVDSEKTAISQLPEDSTAATSVIDQINRVIIFGDAQPPPQVASSVLRKRARAVAGSVAPSSSSGGRLTRGSSNMPPVPPAITRCGGCHAVLCGACMVGMTGGAAALVAAGQLSSTTALFCPLCFIVAA